MSCIHRIVFTLLMAGLVAAVALLALALSSGLSHSFIWGGPAS